MNETKKIEFRIGDVFSSDDPVAGWITGLAMAQNDIVFANSMYLQIENEEPLKGERVYLVRLSASHIREALEFLRKWDPVHEVGQFRESLSAEAKESYEWLHSLWEPWEPSFLRDYLAPMRNQVFHYSKLPTEVASALSKAENVMSSIDVRSRATKDMRAVFADEVAIHLAFGHLLGESNEEWEQVYRALVVLLAEIVGKFATLAQNAIARYIRPRLQK